MEEDVGENNYDKSERIDEEKEAACPDGTPTDDMEEGVSERNNDKNKNMMRKKMKAKQHILRASQWMEVKD